MSAPTSMPSFEDAFDGHVGSCVRDCACGRVFYNPDGGWTWELGELEKLEADPKATRLDYSVGSIEFEGQTFVPDCTCWRPRAAKIIGWIEAHAQQIADFLNAESKRKKAEAERMPTVEIRR